MLTANRIVNNAESFASKLEDLFSLEEKRFLAHLLGKTFEIAFGSEDIVGAGVFKLEGEEKFFIFYWDWNETTQAAEIKAFWFEREHVKEQAEIYRRKRSERRTVQTVDSIIIARNLGQDFVDPTLKELEDEEYSIVSRDYQEAA